jgi:hypothetical protein
VAGCRPWAQWQRSQPNLLIGALLGLVAIAGIAGIYAFSSGAVLPGRVQMIDGFPIGGPYPCADHCAEWTRLARATLNLREHEIVRTRIFSEGHIPDRYGPGVMYKRSGTLIVVVFDLPDGSVRATGVYCGVSGCSGWPDIDIGEEVSLLPLPSSQAVIELRRVLTTLIVLAGLLAMPVACAPAQRTLSACGWFHTTDPNGKSVASAFRHSHARPRVFQARHGPTATESRRADRPCLRHRCRPKLRIPDRGFWP